VSVTFCAGVRARLRLDNINDGTAPASTATSTVGIAPASIATAVSVWEIESGSAGLRDDVVGQLPRPTHSASQQQPVMRLFALLQNSLAENVLRAMEAMEGMVVVYLEEETGSGIVPEGGARQCVVTVVVLCNCQQ
jgi:hypothetical protein